MSFVTASVFLRSISLNREGSSESWGEPGHQGDGLLGRVDILGRELEGEPLEYHGDPDMRLEHREVLPMQALGPWEKDSRALGWLAAALDTPCSNLVGLNSSASWPQTSLSRCSNAIGIESRVPSGTLMLPSRMSEPAALRMNTTGL